MKWLIPLLNKLLGIILCDLDLISVFSYEFLLFKNGRALFYDIKLRTCHTTILKGDFIFNEGWDVRGCFSGGGGAKIFNFLKNNLPH